MQNPTAVRLTFTPGVGRAQHKGHQQQDEQGRGSGRQEEGPHPGWAGEWKAGRGKRKLSRLKQLFDSLIWWGQGVWETTRSLLESYFSALVKGAPKCPLREVSVVVCKQGGEGGRVNFEKSGSSLSFDHFKPNIFQISNGREPNYFWVGECQVYVCAVLKLLRAAATLDPTLITPRSLESKILNAEVWRAGLS